MDTEPMFETFPCPKCGAARGSEDANCKKCGWRRTLPLSTATNDGASPAQTRRRWHQFSLRTLLVVVALGGVGLGLLGIKIRERAEEDRRRAEEAEQRARQRAEEARRLALVEAIGGRLTPTRVGGKVDDLELFSIRDADLARLKELPDLETITILADGVTDATLMHFRELTNLRRLKLSPGGVTGTGLLHLEGLTQLVSLDLSFNPVTDAGLKHLRGLTGLERLDLQQTRITDAGLEHLGGLTNLVYLNLEDTRVTHEGVKKLREALPDCKIRR